MTIIEEGLIYFCKLRSQTEGRCGGARFMNGPAFAVATGPDGSPQRLETVDGAFTIAPLLTPRGPSNETERSVSSSSPSASLPPLLCLSSLVSAFLTAPVSLFELCLSKCRKTDVFFKFFPPQSLLPLQAKRLPNVSLLFTWRGRKIGTHLSGFTECHWCLMNPWLQLQLCIPALQNQGI